PWPALLLLLLLLLLCEGRVFFSPRRRNLVLSFSLPYGRMGTCLSSPPEEPAAIKRLRRSSRGSSGATRAFRNNSDTDDGGGGDGATDLWRGSGFILADNVDLLRSIVRFVAEKQFLFFAP
ncbi:unnamed protein product, partial [Ectocarpus sp. 12 AP-2014]